MQGSFLLASPFVPTSGIALSHAPGSLSSFSHLALALSPSVLPPTYNTTLLLHFDTIRRIQSLSPLLFLLYFFYLSLVYTSFSGGGAAAALMIIILWYIKINS